MKRITSELDPKFLEDQEHEHDQTVTSVGLKFEGGISMESLQDFIGELMQTKGPDLYRYKGILDIKGCNEKYVF